VIRKYLECTYQAYIQGYEGEDRPTELPIHVPEAAMTIEWPDDELYGIYEDEEWLSIFPRSHGWLELGPKDELFVVSMYHQLHCLDSLRYGYASAKAGTLSFPGNGTGVEHHVNHCLTFLKETILCNADLTLEVADAYRPVSPGSTKKQHGVSGMGMVHRCHDWTKVRDWLEVNFDKRLAKGTVDETTTAELIPDE
jgi:hypothetical protein